MSVRGKMGLRLRSNISHWEKLQEGNYFESHPCYLGLRDFIGDEIPLISSFTFLDKSKTVVVIGCGYGRETAYIAPRVRHVYGIDVSGLILNKAVRFLKERRITNFTPVFARSYQTDVPAGIDLVFSIVVMQHLTRDLVFDYFMNLGAKLAPSGMFVVQFLEELEPGAANADAELKVYEPSVSWTIPQLCNLSRESGLTFQEVRTVLVTPTALWHWVCFTKPSLHDPDLAVSVKSEALLTLEEQLEELDRQREAGQWPATERAYNSILNLFPDAPQAWLYTGIRAYEDGRYDLASTWLSRAAELGGDSTTYLYLGNLDLAKGDYADAGTNFKRAASFTQQNPSLPACLLNLAIAFGAQSKFPEAIEQINRARELGAEPAASQNLLGGALANMGELEKANEIFNRQFSSRLSTTMATNSRILTLGAAFESIVTGEYADDELPELAPPRISFDYDLVYFICCDGGYFEKFFVAAATACAANCGKRVLLHVHIVNSTASCEETLALFCSDLSMQVFGTRETTSFSGKSDSYRRTYLACRRFALLPKILSIHRDRHVLCADADQLIIGSLDTLLKKFDHDIALVRDPLNSLNLSSYFSASVLLIRPTAAALSYFDDVRRYISHYIRSATLDWHLDQAALAAVYLQRRQARNAPRFFFLPATTLRADADVAKSGGGCDAMFWTITYSVPSNAAKLHGPLFLKFASRPLRRLAVVSTSVPPAGSGQARVLGHLLGCPPSDNCVLLTDQSPFPSARPELSRYRVLTQPVCALKLDGWLPRLMPRVNVVLGALWGVVRRAKEISGYIKEFHPAVLIACTASPYDLPACTLVALRHRIPLVTYLFDDPVYQWVPGPLRTFARLWAPIWSRIAANVIVPNEAMAEEFARRYRRTPVIVRNPVSPDGMPSPRPWPMIPNQYKIVYTGSVYHAVSDSLVNLIAALAELDNYSLHIYTSQSDDQLAAYGVHGPKVFRHEHVDQTTCYEEQRSADVLFLPLAFHSEIQGVLRTSAPMKMGEYLTSGRPILVHAPADTFIVQHIRQHRAGVVVDIAEPRALADALHEITSNPELRESMRENSLRLAESYDVRRAQEVFWGTVKASMTLEHS